MEKPNFLKILLTNLRENKNALFRLWGIMVIFHFVSLLLGFGIWLITYGIYIIARRIFIYWRPAREKLIKVLGLKLPEQNAPANLPKYWWAVILNRIIISLVFIALGLFCIWAGSNILLKEGFLGQNIIYIIFFKK